MRKNTALRFFVVNHGKINLLNEKYFFSLKYTKDKKRLLISFKQRPA